MKRKIKIVIDAVMSISLLFLMAYQVTGERYHEWIGAGMLVLFLIHNLLNAGWYRGIFKGRYSALRILRTVVNLLVLVSILLTGYSGIVLSRHVFRFLPISRGMALARKLHLAGSYWAFVLMGVHLGMHWGMMTRKLFAKMEGKKLIWSIRILGAILAIAGVWLFIRGGAYRNLFLLDEFAFLDYETPGVLIILQNLLMMSAWIFVGHYLTKKLRNNRK